MAIPDTRRFKVKNIDDIKAIAGKYMDNGLIRNTLVGAGAGGASLLLNSLMNQGEEGKPIERMLLEAGGAAALGAGLSGLSGIAMNKLNSRVNNIAKNIPAVNLRDSGVYKNIPAPGKVSQNIDSEKLQQIANYTKQRYGIDLGAQTVLDRGYNISSKPEISISALGEDRYKPLLGDLSNYDKLLVTRKIIDTRPNTDPLIRLTNLNGLTDAVPDKLNAVKILDNIRISNPTNRRQVNADINVTDGLQIPTYKFIEASSPVDAIGSKVSTSGINQSYGQLNFDLNSNRYNEDLIDSLYSRNAQIYPNRDIANLQDAETARKLFDDASKIRQYYGLTSIPAAGLLGLAAGSAIGGGIANAVNIPQQNGLDPEQMLAESNSPNNLMAQYNGYMSDLTYM